VHDGDEELCKSEVLEASRQRTIEDETPVQIQPTIDLNVPHTSPTPSPKREDRTSPEDLKDWEETILDELTDLRKDSDIHRMANSQMIKISSLVDANSDRHENHRNIFE